MAKCVSLTAPHGIESSNQKHLLHLLYVFKRWHKDAQQDGRARLRIDGRIYGSRFVKVVDPDLNMMLRAKLEELARGYLAPEPLPPAPTEPPDDVWFFRMDPRA